MNNLTITLNSKELSETLKAVYQKEKYGLEGIFFENKDGKLAIYTGILAQKLFMQSVIVNNLAIEGTSLYCNNPKQLLDVLKGISGKVTIESKETTEITVTSENGIRNTIGCPVEEKEIEEYRKLASEKAKESVLSSYITISARQFKEVSKSLVQSTMKHGHCHEEITGIRVMIKDDVLNLTATNSYVLSYCNLDIKASQGEVCKRPENKDYLISVELVQKVSSLINNRVTDLTIRETEKGNIAVEIGDITIIESPEKEYIYPVVENIIPESDVQVVTINKKALLLALKAVSSDRVTITAMENKVIVETYEKGTVKVECPATIHVEFKGFFTTKLLEEILSVSISEDVTFNRVDKPTMSAWHVHNGCMLHLIMPLK